MTAVLETLASYVPALILERLSARPEPLRAPLAETRRGALLLADISGFTRLTRLHDGHDPTGTETLGHTLSRVFTELIDLVHAHGGDVLTFAGDAFLAFWDAGDRGLPMATERAATCALTMQATLSHRREMAQHGITLRIGITAGPVSLLHVGGHGGRWEMLVTGDCLTAISQAKIAAKPGDVICTPDAWPAVADRFLHRPLSDGHILLTAPARALRWQQRPPVPLHPDMQRALHQYLPPSVRERLLAGQTDWLADLRPVTAIFVKLPDLGNHPDLADVQRVMTVTQEILARYEGSIKDMTTDDHGIALVAVFGLPPLSHADDAIRGVQAAMALHEWMTAEGMRHGIGIATGQVFCGVVGSERRRQFAILGDVMVRSARLMQQANGVIWCDEATWRVAQSRVRFQALPPVQLKGIDAPVAVYAPEGRTEAGERINTPLWGRDDELQAFRQRLQALATGRHGSLSLIEGEAGIGKTHLIRTLCREAERLGVRVELGQADPYERSQAYHAWCPIIERLFDWSQAPDEPAARETHLRERIIASGHDPERVPLLSGLLPMTLPDTATTQTLTGKARAERLHDLLMARLEQTASRQPTLVVLEDAHWLDSASWALVAFISRAVPDLMLVLSLRPPEDPVPAEYSQFRANSRVHRCLLTGLGREATANLVAGRLGVERLEQALADMVYDWSDGHPLFSEEIAHAVRDQGLVTIVGGMARLTGVDGQEQLPDLPTTVTGVITGRIDRLPPSQQLLLKAASVIGRQFAVRQLREIFPLPERSGQIDEQLATLARLDLIVPESDHGEASHRFKHATVQEAVYGLMPFEQRRQLHQAVALWYERHQQEGLGSLYPLLAYHWSKAADHQRSLTYLELAGEQALRNGAYREASRFLRDALALVSQQAGVTSRHGRPALQRWLGEALLGEGHLPEARLHIEQSLLLSGGHVPRSATGILLATIGQALRQFWHRCLPPQPIVDEGLRSRSFQAAQLYTLLCEIDYFANDPPRLAMGSLTALNLVERTGSSALRTLLYAGVGLRSSMVPLPRVARHYAKLAEADMANLPSHEQPLKAATILATYWGSMGQGRQAIELLERTLATHGSRSDHKQRGYAASALAYVHRWYGGFRPSLELLQQVHAEAIQHGDVQLQAWALSGLAVTRLRLGELESASILADQALPLYAASQDMVQSRVNEALRALLACRRGEMNNARRMADDLLHDTLQNPPRLASTLGLYLHLADTALIIWETGIPATAVERYTDEQRARLACRLLRQFTRFVPLGRPMSLVMDGIRLWLEGHQAKARRAWTRSLDLAVTMGLPVEEARAHLEIGRHLPESESAKRAHLEQGQRLYREFGVWDDAEQHWQLRTGQLASSASVDGWD